MKYEANLSKLSNKSIERIKRDVAFNFNTSKVSLREIRKFERQYYNIYHGYPTYGKLVRYILRNL